MNALKKVRIQIGVDENGFLPSENRSSLPNEINEIVASRELISYLAPQVGFEPFGGRAPLPPLPCH